MIYQCTKNMAASEVIEMWQWCRKNLCENTWDYSSTREPDHNLADNEKVIYIWNFTTYDNFAKFLEKINATC